MAAGLGLATGLLGIALAGRLPAVLSAHERVVVGLVVALVGVDLAGYRLAYWLSVSPLLVLVLTALAGIGAMLLAYPQLDTKTGPGSLRAMVLGKRPGALAAVILVLAAGLAFIYARAVQVTPQAWTVQYNNVWSDWALHASHTTTFAYGENLPPHNPLYAGTPLRYPFAPDFASALLLAGGWSLPAALIWPGWAAITLALVGLVLWAKRLAGGILAGAAAASLALLGGGLGFWFFFGDAARLGIGPALAHLPRAYDRFDTPVNIQWYTPILAYYLPQRSFVFGAAIVVAVLLLLTPVLLASALLREGIATLRARWPPRLGRQWPAFLLAGVLAGTLPWFHLHSLVVLGIVTAGWAILFPRTEWAVFFAAALLIAAPRLLFAIPGDASAPAELHYPRLQIGWLAGEDGPLWFWIKNTGAFWPLLLVALLSPAALGRRAQVILSPFLAVFLVANLVVFQPWDWDNTKILIFWYLAGAVAVGALLARLWGVGWPGRLAAAALWLSLVAAGALSLLQVLPGQGPSYLWFTHEEVVLAEQVRRATPPDAVFLTGDRPNNPVADLAGRTVVMSYRGWLWTQGIDYRTREADVGRMYAGEGDALTLLHRYGVGYVLVGPDELGTWHANLSFFDQQFRIVARTENYRVYAVPA